MATTAQEFETPVSQRRFPAWLLPLATALIVVGVYANTLGFEFVYDDYGQIQETTRISSWNQIPSYFTTHVWSGKVPNSPGSYYRPVFMIWLLLNNKMFGPDPAWWHATTVAMHVLATLLVFFVARRLTEDDWAAGIAGLIFGLHPTHLESVAWVSGVTDPLMTAFLLASFLCYLNRGKVWFTASVALFAAALLEKETAIVFPAILIAYEALWMRRGFRWLRISAFVLVTLLYLAARYHAMHAITTIVTPLSRTQLVLTAPSLLAFYAYHLIWPFNLSPFYAVPVIGRATLSGFWLPLATITLLATMLFLIARRSRVVAFCAVWLVIPILPALNIRLFMHNEVVHDRYLYFPCVAFAILAALAIRSLTSRAMVQAGIVLLIAAGLTYGSVRQSDYWSTNISLFTRGVQTAPENEVVVQGMGTALLIDHRIDEALPFYKKAVQLRPDLPEGWYSVGRCYYELDMFSEALPFFEQAIRVRRSDSKSYLYYAFTQLKLGNLQQAEAASRAALQIRPPDDFREYHLALGMILKAKGDIAGAGREFEAELRENPESRRAVGEMRQLGQ